jgi:hypothetical protein
MPWPIYFATRSFVGSRFSIKKGQRLPDSKATIRALLAGAGVRNAQSGSVDFSELPVAILDAHDQAGADMVNGKSLEEARVLLAGRTAKRVA